MDFAEEFSMHECRKEEVGWESSVKLALMREEEIGMYLEEREGRKRKWDGKTRRDSEERDHRKVPPKKIMAALGDMGGSGTSSSSSHNMSPGWQVNDLDLDLPTELSMNEALLSLPSLAVFKQEAPSPTGAPSPPRRAWPRRDDRQQITSMVVDARDGADEGPPHAGALLTHHGSPELPPSLPPSMLQMNGYHSPSAHDNKTAAAGLLMCSPAGSLDGFLAAGARAPDAFRDDTRFQYVLAAATSIATKQNEETLTYLNQGQPYEIKLKKLGDLSHYKGKILKSVIKICFHERRLQYMEREQIAQWHQDRPGDRIVEVDVPLSYGVTRVEQPAALNALHVYWDPTKDVGVYIKVNCISTEFTAKKHGGEKGVPFRIQVETSLASDDHRLHAAACQIKVFKLKGADRKHKQDREKVLRRPRGDPDKYQPGCDATVLTTLSNDALLPPPSLITASPPYSPEMCVSPKSVGSPMGANKNPPAILAASNQMKPLYCPDEMKARSPGCPSPGAILPDLPQPADDPDSNGGLSKDASIAETQAWLVNNRFSQYAATFANFTGADLLRLSREDATALCGLADGLRLLNALVGRRIAPRLTVYVRADDSVYSALYLAAPRAASLAARLAALADKEVSAVFVRGPRGARVRLTDELVRHLPDHSTYRLEREGDRALVLCPENN